MLPVCSQRHENEMMPLYYDDLKIGQSWTTPARTVTEADLVNFAGLTGDMHPIHTDADYSKDSRFGGRIAHGFLVASIASGLGYRLRLTEGTVIANLGFSWRFQHPVMIGDTIHVVMTVIAMRPSEKNPDAGVVTRKYEVRNHKGDLCATGEVSVLFKRRPKDGA